MESLNKLRKKIDQADDKILKALAARRTLTDRVLRAKRGRAALRDVRREEQIRERIIRAGKRLGLDAHLVTRVFSEIIDDSLRTQRLQLLDVGLSHGRRRDTLRVAFQGIEGAYSQMAAYKFFAKDIEKIVFAGCVTFDDAVRSVERGSTDYALLPIENTTAGSINQVYDLLFNANLSIVGEEVLRIDHCLLGLADASIHKIRRILSHPQALAQCSRFLAKLAVQTEFFADTAMAVRKVREDRDPSQAAIASAEAGRKYGLKILQKNLADRRENFTRFIVVAKEPARAASLCCGARSFCGSTRKERVNSIRTPGKNTSLRSRPRTGSPELRGIPARGGPREVGRLPA